ncbi:MAG: phosphoglycerate dehydrogenase [Alphaproteobacteria bacterium]|nr:phosphoglycerate dehydrogenase [Alphaproteobacteria bacterium]
MPKVLISDKLSPEAAQIFRDRGIEVDVKPGLSKDELIAIIGGYDGLAIRSNTKVTPDILAEAKNLKVVGRAGIGVDNVDLPAATARGVVVMNTPFGNSVTTAEHAIAMMMALVRQIPQANASTHAGKWEKSKFMGTEITGKTLGVVGCGNIGSIVANRGKGLQMKVIAYDPFLTEARAEELGVEKVELAELLKRADIVTLHTPLTDQTRNIIDAKALKAMKKGARIVNCARGGLVDEAALKAALDEGHIAGAALDVFLEEPAKANVLFGDEKVIATPHLGASTTEAQEMVALQVAEQMSDYLLTGAVVNAVNMPSISADEAPRLKPFVELAEKLGLFAGQLTETGITEVQLEYEGTVAEMNTKPMTAAALMGLLKPQLEDVNMVSAPVIAKERGLKVQETKRAQGGIFETYIRLSITTESQTRSVAGTIYSSGQMRIIQIKGINMDAELGPHMLYVTNQDKPGFIGALGTLLGQAGINIATFNLGRAKSGGDAIALIEVDQPVPVDVLAKIRALPHVVRAQTLKF